MKLVGGDLLQRLASEAAASPRLRANHNLHPTLSDPVQRFLNAMQPGTYVRPHRHPEPRWELFLALAGSAAVLLLDPRGMLEERLELSAEGPDRAVELPPGRWHTVVCMEQDTVLFELKPGPYQTLTDKDFAPWAPAEGEPGAVELEARMRAARPGTELR